MYVVISDGFVLFIPQLTTRKTPCCCNVTVKVKC